jgi:aspartate/methionine/tyrosine aminotransferase
MVPTMRVSIDNLPPSGIGLLLAIAGDSETVSLGVGEPNFNTPKHVIDAAHEALRAGKTHYSPDHGILELREAIADKIGNDSGVQLDPEGEVIVSAGTSPAVFNAMMSLIDTGEEILIPEPSYFAYEYITRIIGAKPVFVPSYEENGFVPTAEDIADCISPKSKVLVICSPNNPTGSVWSREDLRAAADIAEDHDLIVLSDELYQRIVYDGAEAQSMASIGDMNERTLIFNGLSKSHAMAGFRVGWIAGRRELLDGFKMIHEYNAICAPVISQYAALAALTGPDEPVQEMVAEYARRRELLINRINDEVPLVSVKPPKGSFFMFPNIQELAETHHSDMVEYLRGPEGQQYLKRLPSSLFRPEDLDQSWSLAVMLYLYAKARVVTASGALFGESGEGFLRLSYAQNPEVINEGLERTIRSLEQWG